MAERTLWRLVLAYQKRSHIATTVIAALVVPVAIVYVAVAKSSPASEPFPDESTISELFAKELSIGSGSKWNGSVYLLQSDYRKQLTLFTLWKQQIPTLNQYDQTLDPFYYFMTTKVLFRNDWDLRRLAALGVRYLMVPGEAGDQAILDVRPENRDTVSARILTTYRVKPKPRLRHVFLGPGQGYGDFAWLVYELSDPNHGQYTPTTVKLASDANEYLQLLTQPDFDWHQHVALESDPGPLTIAEETKLYVEAGRVRVEAKNAGGRSLALLPIKYSNCLKVSGSGNPQLVRANLLLTGLLFSGESRVWIDFVLSFFRAGCRWSDIADMKRLKIPETAEILQAERHPFAIKSISDIPLHMNKLLDHYRKLQ